MIVELFAPPAAGKTTCAFKLAEALRTRGHRVDLLMSLRPGEKRDGPRQSRFPVVQRLLRPMYLLASDLRHAAGHGEAAAAARRMLAAMPPRSLLWSVRLYRYLLHLHCAWEAAAQVPHMVLVDQGFVQATASLVLLSGCRDEARIDRELAALPRPDLLIGLLTPTSVLRQRLAARLPAQGWMERWLELSMEENLRFTTVITDLRARMERQGLNSVWVSSLDEDMIETIVARVEQLLPDQRVYWAGRASHPAPRAGGRVLS